MTETKAQQDCEYCHMDHHELATFQNSSLVVEEGALVAFEQWNYYIEDRSDHVDEIKINFCPMCGRKFEEDDD